MISLISVKSCNRIQPLHIAIGPGVPSLALAKNPPSWAIQVITSLTVGKTFGMLFKIFGFEWII